MDSINEEIQISKLPKEQGWKVNSLNLYKYQNFFYFESALKGIFIFRKNFIPQSTDIILATSPKSGTTWLKALAFAIHTRTNGDPDSNSNSPLLSKNPHEVLPFIEMLYASGIDRDLQNPLVPTHVDFHALPESILNSGSKIIYLWRDAKDVFVSQFHYMSKFGEGEMIPFEEAYEKFCNGVSMGGPYWDHVLGYWKASLEFPEKVLFFRYEELKHDTCFYVKKIADFMGCPFSTDEEKQGTVEKIVQLCSFESLSGLDVNKKGSIKNPVANVENEALFRKGKVGDWKNYLTPEMGDKIDQITRHKFSSSGLRS